MNGHMIHAILIAEVLYPITFPTSFPAFPAMRELMAGWNVHMARGKRAIIGNNRYIFLFIANRNILIIIRRRDN